jgi:hypothetical protein
MIYSLIWRLTKKFFPPQEPPVAIKLVGAKGVLLENNKVTGARLLDAENVTELQARGNEVFLPDPANVSWWKKSALDLVVAVLAVVIGAWLTVHLGLNVPGSLSLLHARKKIAKLPSAAHFIDLIGV